MVKFGEKSEDLYFICVRILDEDKLFVEATYKRLYDADRFITRLQKAYDKWHPNRQAFMLKMNQGELIKMLGERYNEQPED